MDPNTILRLLLRIGCTVPSNTAAYGLSGDSRKKNTRDRDCTTHYTHVGRQCEHLRSVRSPVYLDSVCGARGPLRYVVDGAGEFGSGLAPLGKIEIRNTMVGF